jgi:hypothetical protein
MTIRGHFAIISTNIAQVVKQVLIDNFADRQGNHLVKSDRYILQDSVTGRDLDMNVPFHQAIRPGQKVVMTMVFFSEKTNTCPRCATVTLSNNDQDINW